MKALPTLRPKIMSYFEHEAGNKMSPFKHEFIYVFELFSEVYSTFEANAFSALFRTTRKNVQARPVNLVACTRY
jgi:hypothetical protein